MIQNLVLTMFCIMMPLSYAQSDSECLLFKAIDNKDKNKVEQLLQQKVNVNARDSRYQTPLMRAVQNNAVNIVDLLIANKADVNADTSSPDMVVRGKTPLMMAAEHGNVAIMKKLIKAGADVDAVDGWDQPSTGKPVMRYALDSGSLNAVQTLIDAKADLNAFTVTGLMVDDIDNAPNVRNTPLLSYAIYRRLPITMIRAFIKGGADVNKKSMFEAWTPLMVAAYTGYTEAVKELLKAGADKSIKNTDGRTALAYATIKGHTNIIKLLQDEQKSPYPLSSSCPCSSRKK